MLAIIQALVGLAFAGVILLYLAKSLRGLKDQKSPTGKDGQEFRFGQ
ncbi:MAG: hypothetical protein J2P21_28085 [Chloracidobacterium sp.]|nr:hypothetical protein [Chloracidobacterium sp.]